MAHAGPIVKVTSPLDYDLTSGNLYVKGRFGFELAQGGGREGTLRPRAGGRGGRSGGPRGVRPRRAGLTRSGRPARPAPGARAGEVAGVDAGMPPGAVGALRQWADDPGGDGERRGEGTGARGGGPLGQGLVRVTKVPVMTAEAPTAASRRSSCLRAELAWAGCAARRSRYGTERSARSDGPSRCRSGLPTQSWRGREILCSESEMPSSHWASHPGIRPMAKSTGNISTRMPMVW